MSETPRWKAYIFRLLPPCEQITRIASLKRDGVAGPGDYLRMRAHFLICEWCRRFAEQIDRIGDAAGTDPEIQLTEEQKKRILERLKKL